MFKVEHDCATTQNKIQEGREVPNVTLPDMHPYVRIADTTPAPTVRPPSRIAKRIPFSIAIG